VDALRQCDVEPDIIAAGYIRSGGKGLGRSTNRAVAVASVQTLVRRLEEYPAPTLIICDEAHHCAGGNTWSTIVRHYGGAKLLGVTATPIRLDGRGLAAHFDKLIIGPSVRELIAAGYLAPARVFAPPTVDISGLHVRAGDYRQEEAEALMDVPTITGDALTHYRRHADGKRALVFCTSVQHAQNVAARFNADGIPSISLNGGTDRSVRRMAVADFKEGKIRVMASCDIFSEGFDAPGTEVGILLRPTASEGLWRQQIGRCLRPAPGKSHAIIFDHVGSSVKFGLPDQAREWTLTANAVRRSKKAAPQIRVCPKCFAASPARSIACGDCGHVFPVTPRAEVEERDGELVEVTPEQIARRQERMAQGRASTLAELTNLARITGKSEAWALHVFQARERKRIAKERAKRAQGVLV
jgi:superfamily II DNA or RNA helicase